MKSITKNKRREEIYSYIFTFVVVWVVIFGMIYFILQAVKAL